MELDSSTALFLKIATIKKALRSDSPFRLCPRSWLKAETPADHCPTHCRRRQYPSRPK